MAVLFLAVMLFCMIVPPVLVYRKIYMNLPDDRYWIVRSSYSDYRVMDMSTEPPTRVPSPDGKLDFGSRYDAYQYIRFLERKAAT